VELKKGAPLSAGSLKGCDEEGEGGPEQSYYEFFELGTTGVFAQEVEKTGQVSSRRERG